jgi:hypothetical protein
MTTCVYASYSFLFLYPKFLPINSYIFFEFIQFILVFFELFWLAQKLHQLYMLITY